MEPLISINVRNGRGPLQPEETLEAQYQIDAVSADQVQAVEASVLWHTEGKGEEDIGVHFFQRFSAADGQQDLRRMQDVQTVLPASPLSYNGIIVKVRWVVRVRVFMRDGREFMDEVPFRLGAVATPPPPPEEEEELDEEAD